MPTAHREHEEEPGAVAYAPAEHTTQLEPADEENVPISQFTHEVGDALPLDLPAAQAVQIELPEALLYFPAVQLVQNWAPGAAAIVPDEHAVQDEAFATL